MGAALALPHLLEADRGTRDAGAPRVNFVRNRATPQVVGLATFRRAKMVSDKATIVTPARFFIQGHDQSVNAIAWAPHSHCHICSAGDDSQALIWDLQALPRPIEGAPCE